MFIRNLFAWMPPPALLFRARTLACFGAIATTTLSATLFAFYDRPADLRRTLALLFIFSLQAGFISSYVRFFQEKHAQSLKTTFGICALLLATFTLGLFLSKPPWSAEIIPLTLTAMILSLVYNPQFSLVLSFHLTLAIRLMLGSDVGQMLIHLGGLTTAILMLPRLRSRSQVVRIGLCTGGVYALMTFATAALEGHPSFPAPSPGGLPVVLGEAFRNSIWGALSGFLLLGLLPWIEKAFGIVTDISLVELADGSHPLLQELLRRAPGTYTHSMTVATLAESGAEAIGADRLLVRVGSYFHDVGKMLKPHYFVENQLGKNRHDDLEPPLSTLVILAHVKDGLSLGRQHELPRPILDFIAQHHGTTLVEYFYREALRLQQGEPSLVKARGMDSRSLEA